MLGALKLRERSLDECSKQQRTIVLGKGLFKGQWDGILQEEFYRGCWRGGESEGAVLCPAGRPLLTQAECWWLDWPVLEVRRGRCIPFCSPMQGTGSVFHWTCWWRKDDSKMAPWFCILKMRNLGEIVILEMRFGNFQHKENIWNTKPVFPM